ncbi:aminoglycoside phosphotransferase family protein [Clostridium sp. 'deep sea']|uniref:aminoglycoside phosphotransferase family protein n=1 Tax=Clostridium sp. 'deep sea' TaxID=2779445 RepID=UPI0018964ACA|nr:aminoglycoside phosphotransferase family protein [Clostridium sp. 'deep sea']QOR36867.1 aminoglycoside phosphotransferase family protein [Clostridium sp. 'deep sea']
MKDINYMLKTAYGINCRSIVLQQGGWSALAYKVFDGAKNYFLKAYEVSRSSTSKLTSMIDIYVPVTMWLNQNPNLSGKLPMLVLTKNGDFKYKDKHAIYLLYEYIEGETIGNGTLTEKEVEQFCNMIAELHCFNEVNMFFDVKKIKETFNLPFLQPLKENLIQYCDNLPEDLKALLINHLNIVDRLIHSTEKLALSLIKNTPRMVLCHTDLHNWNLMRTKNTLILIDWEGLKIAPPEADIMFLKDKPYYHRFLKIYQKRHRDFRVNPDALQFYIARRKLEDIWEFVEQLLFDSQDKESRSQTFQYLKMELEDIVANPL